MSVQERVRGPVSPVLDRIALRGRLLSSELVGLLVVCLAGGLVAGFFLGLYRAGHYSVPVGYDSIYRYLPDTALVSAKGLTGASEVVLPPPFRAFTSRVGFPVLVLSLSRLLGVSTFKFAAVVPVAAIAAVGLAAGALVTSSLRRGALELSAVALIVGMSTQMVRLLVPEAYADNIFSAALFVAALVPLLPYLQGRRGFVPASLLLAASGLAHPSFFSFELVILGVVGLLYAPSSWRSWRRQDLPLLATPVARLIAVMATASAVLAFALYAILGTGPQVPWFARGIFWQKLRADLHLYRFAITVPLALAGAGALVAELRRRSRSPGSVALDGGGASRPGGGSSGPRFLLLLSIAWVIATAIGILAFSLGRPVPVHRLLAFLLPLPLLAALAILALARLAGTKGGPVAAAGVALAGIALFGIIAYDNLYRDIPRTRGVQPVGRERIESAATAAAFLDRAGVAYSKPVVFIITDLGKDPRSGIPLAAYAIRTVLPVERAERSYFYVGEPEDYLASRPARYPGDQHGLNRVSVALWPAVRRILPDRPIALLPRGYNPAFPKIAAENPEWAVAPGVLVVRGPRPPIPMGKAPIPLAPIGGIQLAIFGAGTLAILGLIGLGWALALLPSGLRAFELLALADAFGIGFLVLGGALMDSIGLRLGEPVGVAVAPLVAATGWLFAGWRHRRERSRREELSRQDGSSNRRSSGPMLAARLKTDGGADGSANLSSDSAARDPRKPRGWARAQLAREIYWAADPVVPRPEVRSTARLSEIMREFERSLRADARAAVPKWEPTLRVGRRWRRVTKRAMFRLLRPVTRRYDRVAADLAMLEGSLAQQLERSDAEIRRLDASLAQQLERSDAEIRRLTASLEALEARTTSSLSSAEVGGSQDRAEASVSEGQTSPAAPVAKPPERTQEAEPSGVADPADRFYWLFEERMRGSPDSITSKLRAYEGRVAELRAGAGEGEPPLWIDLGCGQGEFGLLLEEWGWRFRGVDASSRAVEACRSRGLHVTQANLIEYLQSYRGEPPLGISAIQVIEHLPKDLWLRLFLEAKRVLRPGGVLLVETINILAPGPLAQSFFADPTHTWPPHPETVRLMASFAGFARAEVIFLNDDPGGNAQDFALWAVTPS